MSDNTPTSPVAAAPVQHFIRSIIEADFASGKHRTVATRFPPEPNGYLHVGHAKSICLNFGLAQDYQGTCNLRFDDTNPEKESEEYALSIQEDVRWLGFDWNGPVRWASDYFQALYDFAEELIGQGKAYVCDLTPDQMREFRGSLTEPGRPSPYRDRTPSENLNLFRRMKAGEFADGAKTLRAKIDMASPNINMRDPVVYRIKRAHHIRTGDQWCIYPMYDYTHCISDALEYITHSLCTLEFEDHRPLYDWVLEQIWDVLRSKDIATAKEHFKPYILQWASGSFLQDALILLRAKACAMSSSADIAQETNFLMERIGHLAPLFSAYLPGFTKIDGDSRLGRWLSRSLERKAELDWTEFVEAIFEQPAAIFFALIDEVRGGLYEGGAVSVIAGGSSIQALQNIERCRLPRQIEFSRLELHYTITSKRKLNQLVAQGHVAGWDDPRMPTIHGMRRRGYTPEGIREFARRIGISKSENVVDMAVLESAIRDDLEAKAPRVMAVIAPLKVVLINYEEGVTGQREAPFHPHHPEFGERLVPLAQEVWIERDDFAEVPPAGWQRLVPGGEVRLRYSYVIKCEEVVKDAAGEIVELRCSLDHDTLGKNPQGRKVKGVIHWVSAAHALPMDVRLYDRLFTDPEPDGHKDVDFLSFLNPDSLRTAQGWVEGCVRDALPEARYQFERLGYFCADRFEHQPGGRLVFNRTVTLKDSWAREQA